VTIPEEQQDKEIEEMDLLGGFLKDRCVVGSKRKVPTGVLYEAYKKWCENSGEKPLTQQKFGTALADRGFKPCRTGNVRSWTGLEVRDASDGSDANLG
jgi:putative DNA primase/helicase